MQTHPATYYTALHFHSLSIYLWICGVQLYVGRWIAIWNARCTSSIPSISLPLPINILPLAVLANRVCFPTVSGKID